MGQSTSKTPESEAARRERKKKKREEKRLKEEEERRIKEEKKLKKKLKKDKLEQGNLQRQGTAGSIQFEDEDVDPTNPFEAPLDHLRLEEGPLYALAKVTHFDVPTLRKLFVIFTEISQSQKDDGVIDPEELTAAMGLKSTCLLARTLFRLFDITQTKKINFRTWASTLSALSPSASLDEKIRWSFQLYDLNQDGSVDINELRTLLIAAVRENVLNLTDEEVTKVCDATLARVDLDKNGTVEYEEYKDLVQDSTFFREAFTLDVNRLCSSFRFRSAGSSSHERLSLEESEQRMKAFAARQHINIHGSESDNNNTDKSKDPTSPILSSPLNKTSLDAATLQRAISKTNPQLLRQDTFANRGILLQHDPEIDTVKPISTLEDLDKALDDL